MARNVLAMLLLVGGTAPLALGGEAAPIDAAVLFGARENVLNVSLSPDGKTAAYITPTEGQGTALRILPLELGAKAKIALVANGKPERLRSCEWVANDRLACEVHWIAPAPMTVSAAGELLGYWRVVAVNTDGSNLRLLSKEHSQYSRGEDINGGEIIDQLPEEDGKVLMGRVYLPEDHTGSLIGQDRRGYGVDKVDTRSGSSSMVIEPALRANDYLSDGHGTIRIMLQSDLSEATGRESNLEQYFYRSKNSEKWRKLDSYNASDHSGFRPVAVDGKLDVAYGLRVHDGRLALFTHSLDGSDQEQLIYANGQYDIDAVATIGRHHRVVGAHYVADRDKIHFFDPDLARLGSSLASALRFDGDLSIIDSSTDESRLLLRATGDTNPGVYYVYDHGTHHLDAFLESRPPLTGVALATVKAVTYKTKDGMQVPAFLTLPPGTASPKGLPALVMPHGGPAARDRWGFDWLAQYFAHQGYAVLQPNYRGSTGYGEKWFAENGFKSWPIAIGDVLDAGRWLVSEGIADPHRLAIFGWSYGGYAALQSVETDPSVFRAAIAVAPVTDLPALVEQSRNFTDFYAVRDYVGTGPQVHEGSPVEHADKIKVPVLLFHGTADINVNYSQSSKMDRALSAAGVSHQFVTFEGLDHYLEDSAKRAELLRRSDAFLKAAFGP